MARRWIWAACWVAVALAACDRLGCAPGPEPDARYRVRGRVVGIRGDGPDRRLAIHHERLDSFRDREGKAAPMPSMTMQFGVAEGVDARTLMLNAPVAIRFDVRWDQRPVLLITELTQLPADTPLVLPEDDH